MSKENINLPKTSFSMKANLPNKEPEILKLWEKIDLYKKLRDSSKGKEIFLEINIFNFKKNLYKKKLKVYFLKFIRRDRKFRNSTALIKQMNKDVIFAKKGLKTKLVL